MMSDMTKRRAEYPPLVNTGFTLVVEINRNGVRSTAYDPITVPLGTETLEGEVRRLLQRYEGVTVRWEVRRSSEISV